MKLKLFLIAASAMALASCSSDEVVKNNEDANAIKFSVVANNASRSAEYWCNYNLPTQFNVWAAVNNKTYFEGESFTKGTSTWDIVGAHRYWPSEQVTFYAAKINTDGGDNFATLNWNKDAQGTVLTPTIDMTTNASAAAQNDLLYALTKSTRTAKDADDATKEANNYYGGTANINFRHALSQIVFKAQNQNPNIVVKIDEVQVCNIYNKGTFTFPTTVTDKIVEKHDQTGNLGSVPATSIGSWDDHAQVAVGGGAVVKHATTDNFGLKTINARKTDGLTQADVVNLTDNTAGDPVNGGTKVSAENATYSLLLIPQEVTAWSASGKPEEQDKAYFKVKCTIQNVADGKGGSTGDVYLWGDASATKYLYVPVNIEWNPGKKYIYTIIFSSTGHGGYDENGDPVLIPIKFNLTVDDFANSSNTNVDADSGNP